MGDKRLSELIERDTLIETSREMLDRLRAINVITTEKLSEVHLNIGLCDGLPWWQPIKKLRALRKAERGLEQLNGWFKEFDRLNERVDRCLRRVDEIEAGWRKPWE